MSSWVILDAGFRFSTSGDDAPEGKTILSAIYSSPLVRALHTARIFADVLKEGASDQGKVELLDDLIERDFGIMAGLPTSFDYSNLWRGPNSSWRIIDNIILVYMTYWVKWGVILEDRKYCRLLGL